jgi:RNA polymerase sigma-70 factor (ECF subfamily)
MEEAQLVSQVLRGSDSALRMFIAQYERLVSHMVARVVSDEMDREEICQDVFMKIYEKLHTFQFGSKLSTWVATIAYRSALTFVKKKKHYHADIDDAKYQVGEFSNITEQEDMKTFIHSLVDQLPVQYKTVLTLFYLEGFSYPEIMKIMDMPEGTVKNYIHRGRQKLKSLVEEHAKTEVGLL